MRKNNKKRRKKRNTWRSVRKKTWKASRGDSDRKRTKACYTEKRECTAQKERREDEYSKEVIWDCAFCDKASVFLRSCIEHLECLVHAFVYFQDCCCISATIAVVWC